jgi:YVTN family beta-propeller protein
LAITLLQALSAPGAARGAQQLSADGDIPLGEVVGRIDHLAFDPGRHRLYVAELGNNSVGIVDLNARRVLRTVGGFEEPQGIGYEPVTDTVYVANGGDGSVRLFRGEDFSPLSQIPLGSDADNVRIDRTARRVYVGYGRGALAVIDADARKRVGEIQLKAHPESFQLDPSGPQIFVNVPDAHEIAVVSRETLGVVASWPTQNLHANFPLAIDGAHARVLSVFREPARLEAFDMKTGAQLGGADACSDADDVFLDAKRDRVYVVCGQGSVDTYTRGDKGYTRAGRIGTSGGSRTGLFVPDLDRLIVAIRATRALPASVRVFRPD